MPETYPPSLVAHRGYSSRYPENSIPAIKAAIEAGAGYVEFDIQVSKDGVPVVCHDSTLSRTANLDLSILDTPASVLDSIDVSEPVRFGSRFKPTYLPRLSQMLDLLQHTPSVHAFIEIKQESLDRFGIQAVTDSVIAPVDARNSNCTIISFNMECLLQIKQTRPRSVGLVIEEIDRETLRTLKDMQPEFLFTSERHFEKLYKTYRGGWRWAVYHTEQPKDALRLMQQGADLVETNDIGAMLEALDRDS